LYEHHIHAIFITYYFIANLSAINWNYFIMCSNTFRRAWVGLLGHDASILIGCA